MELMRSKTPKYKRKYPNDDYFPQIISEGSGDDHSSDRIQMSLPKTSAINIGISEMLAQKQLDDTKKNFSPKRKRTSMPNRKSIIVDKSMFSRYFSAKTKYQVSISYIHKLLSVAKSRASRDKANKYCLFGQKVSIVSPDKKAQTLENLRSSKSQVKFYYKSPNKRHQNLQTLEQAHSVKQLKLNADIFRKTGDVMIPKPLSPSPSAKFLVYPPQALFSLSARPRLGVESDIPQPFKLPTPRPIKEPRYLNLLEDTKPRVVTSRNPKGRCTFRTIRPGGKHVGVKRF